MPAGVRVPHRGVVDVRVAVQVLRAPRLGHDGVRLDEAAYRRVVPPRVVIVQPDDAIPPLAGEAVGQGDAAGANVTVSPRRLSSRTMGRSGFNC